MHSLLLALPLACALAACGSDASSPSAQDTSTRADTPSADTSTSRDSAGSPDTSGPNHPPSLERIGDRQAVVGRPLILTLTARDPDGDPLTFSLFGTLPPNAQFDKAARRLEWIPTDVGATVYLTFVVSDGRDFDRETVRITVIADDALVPPLFTPVSDRVLSPSSPFSIQLQAVSALSETPIFSIQGNLPPDATLTPDGLFAWTPPPSLAGQIIRVVFTASDSAATATQPVRFVIDDTSSTLPRPPVWPSLPSQGLAPGAAWTFTPTATDPNGDPITFALVAGAPDAATWNGQALAWTPSTADAERTFQLLFSATDGTFTVYASLKISVDSLPAGPCTADPGEPNETPATATPLPLPATHDATLCGETSAADVDVYALALPADRDLEATLTFDAASSDLDLYLFDADTRVLAYSEGVTSREVIRFGSDTARTVYLAVVGYGSGPLAAPYHIEASVNPRRLCTEDAFAGNHTAATSHPLSSEVEDATLMICPGLSDFWSLPVACGQRVELFLNILDDADLDLYLYDGPSDQANPVAYAITSDSEEFIDTVALRNPGTWLVEVAGYPSSYAQSSYELLSFTSGACVDDTNTNHSAAAATPLTALTGATDTLKLCCRDDWFSRTLPANTSVLLLLSPMQGSAGLTVYGSDGVRQLASRVPNPTGGLVLFTTPAEGVYFFKVTGEPHTSYMLEWEFDADPSTCTAQSCGIYEVCSSESGACVSDWCARPTDCPSGYRCEGGYCVDSCTSDATCRPGYACKRAPSGSFCGLGGAGLVGAGCWDHTDCAGAQVCLFDTKGGYCAQAGCDACPSGTQCATVAGQSFCAKRCVASSDCRTGDGFTCSAEKTCLPQNR